MPLPSAAPGAQGNAEALPPRNSGLPYSNSMSHIPEHDEGASSDHMSPSSRKLANTVGEQARRWQRRALPNRSAGAPPQPPPQPQPDLGSYDSLQGLAADQRPQPGAGLKRFSSGLMNKVSSLSWDRSETSVKRGKQWQETVRRAQEDNRVAKEKAASALTAIPSTKVMTAKKRREVEGEAALPPFIIHPYDLWYRIWLALTCLAAVWTGIYVPFAVAFQHTPGLYPFKDGNAVYAYIFEVIFGVDMVLSFRVAYIANGDLLVTEQWSVAKRYLKGRFWIDLLAWFPFDWIVLGAYGPSVSDTFHRWISLLQLLHLLRLYRVMVFFRWLEYRVDISLFWVTLARNLCLALFICHFAACCLYFIARQKQFRDNTWVGANFSTVAEDKSTILRYFWAMYWSVITFATVGYGDLHAYNEVEACFIVIYVLFNIWVNAWIVGTITLTIIRHDARTGRYRELSGILKRYCAMNSIPRELRHGLESHLRLHFNNSESSDDAVLSSYPTTLKRRVLRHLYLDQVKDCYLFEHCRQRMLDAVLTESTVHLFMPKVEVLVEGDLVNELYIVVGGLLEMSKAGQGEAGEDVVLEIESNQSVRGGYRRLLSESDCFGEVAFFTEVPQLETVRTLSVCRILTMPRSTYQTLKAIFPIGTRQVLDNLQRQAEQAVQLEFDARASGNYMERLAPEARLAWASEHAVPDTMPGNGGIGLPLSPFAESSQQQRQAAQQAAAAVGTDAIGMPTLDGKPISTWDPYNVPQGSSLAAMNSQQQKALGALLRVRTLVQQHAAKHDEERTEEFLYAAARGDAQKVQQMLQQGFLPDSTDYDGRTALHLAACKGNVDVIHVLLASGVKLSQPDAFGQTPVADACKHGQDEAIDLLVPAGARLSDGQGSSSSAEQLCECIFRGDLPLMRRFLRCCVDVNAGDYDQRRPLHIAAAEVNLTAVKMLVSSGADVHVRDRWGHTPLDEARAIQATQIIAFLEATSQAPAAGGASGPDQRRGSAQAATNQAFPSETSQES